MVSRDKLLKAGVAASGGLLLLDKSTEDAQAHLPDTGAGRKLVVTLEEIRTKQDWDDGTDANSELELDIWLHHWHKKTHPHEQGYVLDSTEYQYNHDKKYTGKIGPPGDWMDISQRVYEHDECKPIDMVDIWVSVQEDDAAVNDEDLTETATGSAITKSNNWIAHRFRSSDTRKFASPYVEVKITAEWVQAGNACSLASVGSLERALASIPERVVRDPGKGVLETEVAEVGDLIDQENTAEALTKLKKDVRPLTENLLRDELVRNCFSAETDHYLSFAWWIPPEYQNAIQTDEVAFDIGLYTEQCRHNDGSGADVGNTNGASG